MPDTKELLKRVKKLEIKTKHLVDGLLQGAYLSIFKGRGIEFSEVREYQYGDEIKIIDWNVTARTNQVYVKEFVEERDITVLFVFDVSASNEFGQTKEKKESAVEICASLAFAALKNNDNVGCVLFSNGIQKYIPARKGKKHILHIIKEILFFKPKDKTTDLNTTLMKVAKILKKRSIVFVMSDFQCKNFIKPLKILKSKHDVIAINLHDITEKDIPDIGYVELEDAETGEQLLVDTSNSEVRKEFSRLVKEKNSRLKNDLNKIKISLIQLLSGESFDIPLRKFFRQREKQIMR